MEGNKGNSREIDKEKNKENNNENKRKAEQERLWKVIRGEKPERTAEEREQEQRARVHTLQTALWVCLILFQMAVLQSITVRAETRAEDKAETWAEARTEDEVAMPTEARTEAPTETPAAMSASPLPATPSDAGGRLIQREVVYRQVEGAAELPDTLKVTVKENGDSEVVLCQIVSAVPEREQWVDDFSFPVTFHTYGAQYYQVGDLLITEEGDQPPLETCREELLRMLGLSSDAYEITEAVWDGDAYPAEDGTLCRDALVRGRKLVRDYRVRYAGSLTLSENGGSAASSSLSGISWGRAGQGPTEENQTGDDGAGEQSGLGTGAGAEVRLEPESSVPARDPMAFWKVVTRTLLIIIGIGALLFFGGLVNLAVLRLAKSVRKWYTVHENKKSWKR